MGGWGSWRGSGPLLVAVDSITGPREFGRWGLGVRVEGCGAGVRVRGEKSVGSGLAAEVTTWVGVR